MATRRNLPNDAATQHTMRTYYPHRPASEVAALMGVSESYVYKLAAKFGLKKTAQYMATQTAGRIQPGQPHGGSRQTQFKPGQKPWNAGRKGWQAGGRSVQTQFTTGMEPPNTLPLGSHRLVRNHATGKLHLERKMSEQPGPNHLRWVPVSRLVWIAAHGEVPQGSIVVFKPGMATTVLHEITLDKLELITRAQNAKRNHPNNISPEVGRLSQLKGAITRQVNRITQEQAKQAQQNPSTPQTTLQTAP